MRTEFKILWIDDSQAWVESIEPNIREYLEELDFEPIIERHGSGDAVAAEGIRDDVDLLVVDYRLPGYNGDEIISRVRERRSFTDIVFYSQEVDPNNVLGPVNGIYRCARNEAEETMCRVIEEATKKVADLCVYRGRIIAEIIDLENVLEQVIARYFGKYAELVEDRFFGAPVQMDFSKKYKLVQGLLNDALKKCNIDVAAGGDGFGGLGARLEVIGEALKVFEKEIIDQRNILAHARVLKNDDGQMYLNGINNRTKSINFDDNWKKSIRIAITKHRENIASLFEIVDEIKAVLDPQPAAMEPAS